ncbi:MAG: type II toxin-antitoxin system RelE/ParE family toxin [Desulfobacteraceae bacterium]|jgi:plasmid stabilization system protein ParE
MSQTYQIVWAGVAESDLKEIIEYIAIDSPGNALNIFTEIRQSASSLYTSPERGRIVPELQNQGILTYRELVIPPWRIVYRISAKHIYVLSVLDSRRNVEDILLKRLAGLKQR